MQFAPQHDHKVYDAAIKKQLQSQPPQSMEQKFQRYAAYYNTLLQARRQLERSSQARIDQKREKLRLHVRLVETYKAMDGI